MVGLEEGSAILFDPYDIEGMATAVIDLLKDSAMRQSITMRGKKLAERFSHQHSAEEVLALYTRLVQSKKQRAK
jgi:glycosyltransferase involved in cell wall biosynthesis